MTSTLRFFNRPRLWRLVSGLVLLVAQAFTPAGLETAQAATPVCTTSGDQTNCTITFKFKEHPSLPAPSSPYNWTVPAGVTQATFDLYGAAGTAGYSGVTASTGDEWFGGVGGKGGRVRATLAVRPGAIYQIWVGGQAGFNGGGSLPPPLDQYHHPPATGGGASDVRIFPFELANRLLVAGGGGGGGSTNISSTTGGSDRAGADGGYPAGGGHDVLGGEGGTQSRGGSPGIRSSVALGGTGSLGQGGAGGAKIENGGGGGGGGYYGGGGGSSGDLYSGGGGGGSSYGPVGATFENGVHTGDGVVTISYTIVTRPVIAWGANESGQSMVPAGLKGIAVAAGLWHSLALKSDGTVVAWGCGGDNNLGQCTVPNGLYGVVAIAAGVSHNLVLRGDGTVVGWGSNFEGQLNIPAGLNGVVAVAGGLVHSLALKGDGTVVAWGCNVGNVGQCTVPADLSNVVAIAAGRLHSMALKRDGTVVVWGQHNLPSGLSGVVAIAARSNQSLALLADGTVMAWGPAGPPPAGLQDVVAIAAGEAHHLALKRNGTVITWGDNGAGQRIVPNGVDGVIAVAAGVRHNVVLGFAPPSAFPSQTPAANANGWNNSDVTVEWRWQPNGSDLDPANCPASSTSSGEGPLTLTATCLDGAGKHGSASYTVQVDKTAPVVEVTGVSNGAVYDLGSVPAAACTTSDARSEVATSATASITGGNPDGSGTFTATCSGATDKAGNSAALVSVSYTVNAPPTPTPTNTPIPPTATPTDTPVPPTSTPINTPVPPTNTPSSSGVLVGQCGPYTVYQTGTTYSAAGWNGAIKVGTNGNNTLTGTTGADLLLGLGGNDKLAGKEGDDLLCGGDGVDQLLGAAGNDYLEGGAGNDVLNGGAGDFDTLSAEDGNDTLLDNDGVLKAIGGAGADASTIALRDGWRDQQGQPRFTGLAVGAGDAVELAIRGQTRLLVDIMSDAPAQASSPLVLAGLSENTSILVKFEKGAVLPASLANPGLTAFAGFAVDPNTLTDDSGAEFLTEPVGDDAPATPEQTNRLFLPLVAR